MTVIHSALVGAPVRAAAILQFTYFQNARNPQGTIREIAWNDLCDWIEQSAPTAATKAELPLIKLATFAGDYRNNSNLATIYGIEADYDAGAVTPDEAVAALRTWGIAALVYTSPSYRPGAPRWRVLCPLSRPHGPDDRFRFVARLNGVLGGVLASESFTPSQSFFVGQVTGLHAVQTWRADGACIDALDVVDTMATFSQGDQRQSGDYGPAPSFETYDLDALMKLPGGADRVAMIRNGIGADRDYERETLSVANWLSRHTTPGQALAIMSQERIAYRPKAGRRMSPDWLWKHGGVGKAFGDLGERNNRQAMQAFGGVAVMPSQEPTVTNTRGEGALIYFRGGWYTFEPGGFYRNIDVNILRRGCYTNGAQTKTDVDKEIDRLKADSVIDDYYVKSFPHWIGEQNGLPDARELIVMENGLLNLKTGKLYPHSADLLTFNALPYSFNPSAPRPERWLQFLDEVFASDTETIYELQKMFGYFITTDTRLQKMFSLTGERRSGKGTIIRIIRCLIGENNVTNISFKTITGTFGLQPLIGKQLAIVPDARIGRNTDKDLLAEHLLNISGEDAVTINRKNSGFWEGQLPVKIFFASNELPIVQDASGALVGRYVCFETKASFFGREDTGLTDKLFEEMPGILNWAIEGWRALERDGQISTPDSGANVLRDMKRRSAPVQAFVEECCQIGVEGHTIGKAAAYAAFAAWFRRENVPGAPPAENWFHRSFRAACDHKVLRRPRIDGRQSRADEIYEGVKITTLDDDARRYFGILSGIT